VDWQLWKEGRLLEQERIVKRDIGNFKLNKDKESEEASSPVSDIDLTST